MHCWKEKCSRDVRRHWRNVAHFRAHRIELCEVGVKVEVIGQQGGDRGRHGLVDIGGIRQGRRRSLASAERIKMRGGLRVRTGGSEFESRNFASWSSELLSCHAFDCGLAETDRRFRRGWILCGNRYARTRGGKGCSSDIVDSGLIYEIYGITYAPRIAPSATVRSIYVKTNDTGRNNEQRKNDCTAARSGVGRHAGNASAKMKTTAAKTIKIVIPYGPGGTYDKYGVSFSEPSRETH